MLETGGTKWIICSYSFLPISLSNLLIVLLVTSASYLERKKDIKEDDNDLKSGNKEDNGMIEDTTNVEEEEKERERKKKIMNRKISSNEEENKLKKTTFKPTKKTHSVSVRDNIISIVLTDYCWWYFLHFQQVSCISFLCLQAYKPYPV